jgi:serine/threonine protein kinase
MYEIVMKNHPFKSNNISDLIHKINNNKPILNNSNFSKECIELISDLLVVDYKNRLDWNELFNNKWIYNDSVINIDNNTIYNNINTLDIFFDNDDIEENNTIDNIYNEYVFINKPMDKNILDTFLDSSNEIIKKIKKFI